MKAYYKTHVGFVREQNEDTVLTDEEKGIYILADGMGGHNAGEVASRLAAETLRDALIEEGTPSADALMRGFRRANTRVYECSLEDSALSGMGTTMTALWEDGEHVLLGHVGDSRAYLYMNGRLRQISEDHSMVGEMLRSGVITEDEAFTHPYRNVITRAVGTDRTVRADVTEILKSPGAVWMLCSDGLTDLVRDPEIEKVMDTLRGQEAADKLVELALANGGKDNVSVLVVEVDA